MFTIHFWMNFTYPNNFTYLNTSQVYQKWRCSNNRGCTVILLHGHYAAYVDIAGKRSCSLFICLILEYCVSHEKVCSQISVLICVDKYKVVSPQHSNKLQHFTIFFYMYVACSLKLFDLVQDYTISQTLYNLPHSQATPLLQLWWKLRIFTLFAYFLACHPYIFLQRLKPIKM